jgi:hypothetical protein
MPLSFYMSQRFVRQPIGPQLLKELRGEEPSTGMELDQELALESSKVGKQMLICKMGLPTTRCSFDELLHQEQGKARVVWSSSGSDGPADIMRKHSWRRQG